MTLGRMCEAAARYSDRYDEYVKPEGGDAFQGEPLHWFNIFKDAVNEAYFEIARCMKEPEKRAEVTLGADRVIDVRQTEPEALTVSGVYRADGLTEIGYVFHTGRVIEVVGAKEGERVILACQCLPGRLEKESDEPIFAESAADPMIFIALATARIWQSERRMSDAQIWLNEYYRRLRAIRPGMKSARKRRMPRTIFR